MTTLREIGELAAIERIAKRLPSRRDVVLGVGDDCAVVRPYADSAEDLVLTSDPVIEGTHFETGTPAAGVGHKALARVLSDLAAMGAEPRWGLLDIAAPADTAVQVLDDLYGGAMKLAAQHEFAIVGGDMAEGPALEIHAFGLGSVPKGKALLRSGARPGDVLFVTGELGGGIMGRHLAIEPRIKEGAWLREWATAMIDVSDGLASDVRHMTTQSRTGCDLNASAIPVSPAAEGMDDSRSPLEHALHDGEDFELLFTIPEGREDAFVAAWQKVFCLPCTRIGVMTGNVDLVQCVFPDGATFALEGTGYAHFKGREG